MAVGDFHDPASGDGVDLASEPAFRLGDLAVIPALRQLVRQSGPAEEFVEPRVMQVLVALAKAEGGIVTRDTLVRDCWGGRFVGEDAINRALSRVRRIAEGIGRDCFTVETVTKVGYRLIANGQAVPSALSAPPRPPARAGSRRWLLAGIAGATAAVAGGGLLILQGRKSEPLPADIAPTMQQALVALSQGSREGQNQAIGLYQHVVRRAPDYADGWGALGNAYAQAAFLRPGAETRALRERARAAGRRALALDPGNGLGRAAIATAVPIMGHWLPVERGLRSAAAQYPDNGLLLIALAQCMMMVGRNGEAYAILTRAAGLGPPSPNLYFLRIRTLWSLNRLEETDQLINEAISVYPTHFAMWFVRFYVLMFSGRAGAAIALAEDRDARPTGITEEDIDAAVLMARAFQTHLPADIARAMTDNVARAHVASGFAEQAIQVAAALGRVDEAFALADAYFFGRGFIVPEQRFAAQQGMFSARDDRFTHFLFLPPTGAMRRDGRFGRLVSEIGLERYWQLAGAQPDFRNTQS